jgi:hypothetical protein
MEESSRLSKSGPLCSVARIMKQKSSLKAGRIKGLTPKGLVVGGDYPHLRYGGKWRESAKPDLASTREDPSLDRLIFYAEELRKLVSSHIQQLSGPRLSRRLDLISDQIPVSTCNAGWRRSDPSSLPPAGDKLPMWALQ